MCAYDTQVVGLVREPVDQARSCDLRIVLVDPREMCLSPTKRGYLQRRATRVRLLFRNGKPEDVQTEAQCRRALVVWEGRHLHNVVVEEASQFVLNDTRRFLLAVVVAEQVYPHHVVLNT